MSANDRVAVVTVTYGHAKLLADWMAGVRALAHRPLEVVVVDCASADGSAEVARRVAPPDLSVEVVALPENRGFAGGMNAGLDHTTAPWVLSLNPDARPGASFVSRLLTTAGEHPGLRIGALTGRLLRVDGELLDACGMRLRPTWRHLDRGSGEPDRGQYATCERVFGATGAASLFHRTALDDVAIEGAVFDPDFHSFREDAELCFRLRERGWEIVYEPAATARHERRVTPSRRRDLPAAVNYHSLKNRYLLRLYHQTPANALRTLFPAGSRDLLALAWVLLFERSSLPAYAWLFRNRRRLLARRRVIQDRRTVDPAEIDRWFAVDGLPLPRAGGDGGKGDSSSSRIARRP